MRHLSLIAKKTGMNKKASGVHDHMPTALYVQSDALSPDSEETKQDVQPVWNRVPCRTAGNSLIMKLDIYKHFYKRNK